MTFIAGVLAAKADAQAICASMQRSVPIQAPNWLTFSAPDVCLAVSPTLRLPEDIYDRQPLRLGPLHLVGDIRIDNRSELAPTLGWTQAEARVKADSAFFIAAWERWGKDAVHHLIGGFAAAIWDESSRELTLIRDHVGERTVYFTHSGETFGFASLAGPLRAIPGIDSSLDEDRLIRYLAVLPGAPTQTFFRNIQQLPVGNLLTFKAGNVAIRQYWHPLDGPEVRFKTDEDYVLAFREKFDRAVAARLRTTGGIASQLSGGMDSSSVTATAARLLENIRLTVFTSVPHPTFNDCNPTGRFGDEGPAAAEVAALYPNIDHILVPPASGELFPGLHQLNRIQSHPVFNPLNEMWLSSMLELSRARGISVILQGACGNSTLSATGLIGLSKLFQTGRWFQLAKLIRSLRRQGHISIRGAASWSFRPILPKWLKEKRAPDPADFDFAFSPVHPDQAAANHLAEKTWEEFFGGDPGVEAIRRKMFDYYDIGFANVASTLQWQVELRDPTQDKRIFEYCLSIPIEQYLVGGQTRSLVRRAMRGYLPQSTLARTTRGLQSADWFLTMGACRAEMAEELKQISKSPLATRILDLDRLGRLLDTWPNGGFELASVSDSWHLALIRGLSAGNFIRQFE